jgi:minor histocompatibility antigen H13
MSEPGPLAEIVGRVAYTFTQVKPLISTEIHIILAALFPIVAAAHASLSRPSSAANPQELKERGASGQDDEDSEDEEEDDDEFQRMEGFSRSDALYMPLLAGLVLTGLYFLIKYLKDLDMLNKVLNWYFSTVGLFAVCKLLADSMQFVHSFAFPKWYKDGEGVWHVSSRKEKTLSVSRGEKDVKTRASPLPGLFAKLPLPAHVNSFLWAVRRIPSNKLSFKFYIHSVAAFRTHIGLFGMLGTLLGVTATGYYNFVDKPWWLTNLMGFAFSYTSLQLMSPTTFDTGTLILVGLFFYDIFMVFYT